MEKKEEKTEGIFEKELARLPLNVKNAFLKEENLFEQFSKLIEKKSKEKSMGFFITPEIQLKNNVPQSNFEKMTFNFLLDDFERPVSFFDAKFLLGEEFDKFLIEERTKDKYGQEVVRYFFKKNKNIEFFGTSISILRENCFDSIYDDLKKLGSSVIYSDPRGFISALKTIEIHKNMLLQKFEKYIVVYAGAGSWLRGEKSNDFDIFIVVDDTDVKRMPRLQVKEQLTRIVWQMIREVAMVTGIQIHAQVYLLTDFWDALKDAHPVMFTFLRDGVPFYDRGLYSAWKELLKLGKIRPSPEAIDMHMNAGTQLVDRAKKMFADIAMNEGYYAFLNPAQAVLMLKGYNPTTPKETLKIFKEVLVEKEKSVTKKDYDAFEAAVKLFKELEHNKEKSVKGKDLDKMITEAEDFLKNVKKMFEEISENRTKESMQSSYNELINQLRTLIGYSDKSEKEIISLFEKDYVKTAKVAPFVKDSIKSIIKLKEEHDKGKINITEANKFLKEVRNVLSEIKGVRESDLLGEVSKKKLQLKDENNKAIQIFNYSGKIYLIEFSTQEVYEFKEGTFNKLKESQNFLDNSMYMKFELNEQIILAVKKTLKVKSLFL